jgi:hypothetical protein
MLPQGKGLRRRGLHRDAQGRLVYVESFLPAGLLIGLGAVVALAVQPVVLCEWPDSLAAYFRNFHAVTEWPALIPSVLALGLLPAAFVLMFRRHTLIFDPPAGSLTVDTRSLLGGRTRRYGYDEVGAELRRVIFYGRAFNWHGFELRVFWPGGRMTLCSSVGPRRDTGLERLLEACGRLERETGLPCARRLDEYW